MGHMSDEEAEDLGWSDRFAMEQEEKDRIASLVEEVERLRAAIKEARDYVRPMHLTDRVSKVLSILDEALEKYNA